MYSNFSRFSRSSGNPVIYLGLHIGGFFGILGLCLTRRAINPKRGILNWHIEFFQDSLRFFSDIPEAAFNYEYSGYVTCLQGANSNYAFCS